MSMVLRISTQILSDIDTVDSLHLDVTSWYAEYPEWFDCSLNYPNWREPMMLMHGGLLISTEVKPSSSAKF